MHETLIFAPIRYNNLETSWAKTGTKVIDELHNPYSGQTLQYVYSNIKKLLPIDESWVIKEA